MHFPARAASIFILSIFGHKIGVLKSLAFLQGKELQVTRFKVMRFCFEILAFFNIILHRYISLALFTFFQLILFLFFAQSGSLYNEGMRPLVYSEMDAVKKKIGWVRRGEDIKYYKNAIK